MPQSYTSNNNTPPTHPPTCVQYETQRQVEEQEAALMGLGGHGLEKDRELRLPQVARIRRMQQLQQQQEQEGEEGVQSGGPGHSDAGGGWGRGGGGRGGRGGGGRGPPPSHHQQQQQPPPPRPGATLGQHMFSQYHLQRGRGVGHTGGRGAGGAGGRGPSYPPQQPPPPPPQQQQQQQAQRQQGGGGERDRDFFSERDGRDFLGRVRGGQQRR